VAVTSNIRLLIEYDGTNYVGWQVQANGLSVQQILEEKLWELLGEPVRLISSGRTDAGVHARGMVANFRTSRSLPMRAYREGLNRLLPVDIAVREAHIVHEDFHSRFDARGKWYRYTLYLSPVRSPLARRFSWHLRSELDTGRMRCAAGKFVGQHDFRAFRGAGCGARTTVREIYSVDLLEEPPFLHIDVKGEGFLRNMVRMMAGTLVAVAREKVSLAEFDRLLRGAHGGKAGPTAPAHGLCLMEVWYDERQSS
jgi:tRNA pseudouridine38-40 synthase